MTSEHIAELKLNGVFVADDVDSRNIADDVNLHPGSRIYGAQTSIGPGCELGAEAPVTVKNCQLGRNVELKGGFFSGAVFFDGSNVGSEAHIRPGTIFEEEASAAHAVGLKQTILLPFVTTGSLINFCDLLMAGGTSRKDHSEVGSSYIHFNFTPHQDKATASLIGDVPLGVFLDQKPIFLGGQGGLVGPARVAYGSVIAAGGVCRTDVLEENQLLIPDAPEAGMRSYQLGVYRRTSQLVKNNLIYIGNIMALREWYRQVRTSFVRDVFDQAVLDGGLRNLDLILKERIKRLGDLAGKFEYSSTWLEENQGKPEEIALQRQMILKWPDIKVGIEGMSCAPVDCFSSCFQDVESYTDAIKALDPKVKATGRVWLQSIVDDVEFLWSK